MTAQFESLTGLVLGRLRHLPQISIASLRPEQWQGAEQLQEAAGRPWVIVRVVATRLIMQKCGLMNAYFGSL